MSETHATAPSSEPTKEERGPGAGQPAAPVGPASFRHLGILGLAFITLALMAAEFWYYHQKANQVRVQQHQSIAAIGTLKSLQIQSWRKERLEDAGRMARGPLMRHRAGEFLRNADAQGVRADLMELLQLNKVASAYHAALLLALDGRVLLSSERTTRLAPPVSQSAIAAASASHDAVFSEFLRQGEGTTWLDALAVVRDDGTGEPIAVVVLRCNADEQLFPMIQTWPVPSPSAETMLVYRSGDDILSPHRLRHGSMQTGRLRTSSTQQELPSVQAVLGRQGMFEGTDYRGKPVLADLRPIPGSPWFIVSKMDRDESLAHLFSNALSILVITGAFVLLLGFAMDIREHKRKERLLAASHEHLRTLLAKLQRAQEDERIRISREIHDDLGQLLTGLKMDVHWLERKLSEPTVPPALNPLLDRVVGTSELVDAMVVTVQRIAAELRPTTLDKLGLEATLTQEARRFQERSGVSCTVMPGSPLPELTPGTASDLFYICREALTNVGRHAQARAVEIRWRTEADAVVFEVCDDGVGASQEALEAPTSLGLIGMQERAMQWGGKMAFGPNHPRGTRVTVRVPHTSIVNTERSVR